MSIFTLYQSLLAVAILLRQALKLLLQTRLTCSVSEPAAAAPGALAGEAAGVAGAEAPASGAAASEDVCDAGAEAACAVSSCCASSAFRRSAAAAAALTCCSSASARCSCCRASSAYVVQAQRHQHQLTAGQRTFKVHHHLRAGRRRQHANGETGTLQPPRHHLAAELMLVALE